jgi:hypothetical protein
MPYNTLYTFMQTNFHILTLITSQCVPPASRAAAIINRCMLPQHLPWMPLASPNKIAAALQQQS